MAAYAPTHDGIDHRVFGPWSAGDAAEILRHFRLQLDLAPDFAARYDDVVAANERVLVARMTFFGTARDSGGPFENIVCLLIGFGADGRMAHYEVFEPEQVAEALARFDELSGGDTDAAAGWFENTASRTDRELFERFNARDWAGVEALAAPELVFDERRRMLHNTCGRDVWLEQFRILFDVPASRFTTKLLGTRGERLSLSLHRFTGEVAGGGGPLEMDDHLVLHEVDAEGRLIAIVLFDLEDQEAAWNEIEARFAESGAAHPDPRAAIERPNAATRSMERFRAALDASDFDAASMLFAPGFVWEDRRPLFRLSGDVELMLASAKERLATGARHERRSIVGTAGDRVAVIRVLWAGGPPGGRFEVEFLAVHEVDETGLGTALIFFDPDDTRAAQREAWARWVAIDPVAAPWVALLNDLTDAWNAHDVAKVRACFADDVTVEDHRLAGLGRIEGVDRYVESFVALWALAPDQRVEFGQSCAVDQHGVVFTLRRAGTLESGGAFENEYAGLALAREGRITRLELFEIGALDAALARFEELRAARITT